MSLLRRAARAVVDREIPFDRAEQLLEVARRRDSAKVVRPDNEDAKMLDDTIKTIASTQREARLARWLGWDIAPPPELDVQDPEEDSK